MMLRNHSLFWKSYIVPIEYTYGVLLYLILLLCLLVPCSLKGMPLEDPHNGQVMTEEKMRDILSQMDQAMTTQAQDATVHSQAMTA